VRELHQEPEARALDEVPSRPPREGTPSWELFIKIINDYKTAVSIIPRREKYQRARADRRRRSKKFAANKDR